MKPSATRSEFARNVTEAHCVLAEMRSRARLNDHAIDLARQTVTDSLAFLRNFPAYDDGR